MEPCNAELAPLEVKQGEDLSFTVRLIDRETKDAIDLTLATSISVAFLNQDLSFLNLTLLTGVVALVPLTLGKITITLTPAQTLLLKPGINSFEVTLVINNLTSIVQFQSALTVLQSVFD